MSVGTQLKAVVERAPITLEFVAYGLVGVASLALELGVLHAALTVHLFQPIAVSCGYVCSAAFQFAALRYVVFRVAHKTLSMQAATFILGQVVLWGLLVASVALLTAFLPLATMQARLICVPALFPVNYLVSKYVIFRR